MRFNFPILVIDEDYRSENASGLGIRALAKAINGFLKENPAATFKAGIMDGKLINAQDYYAAYTHYISRVLALPGTVVRLAVLGSDRDIVLGFAVIRGQILEYVHVHKDHRRAGIATKLVPQNVTAITHLTRTALTIWGTGKRPWKFNPFA